MNIDSSDIETPNSKHQYSRSNFIDCAQRGLLKYAVSRQAGGNGSSFIELCKAHENYGENCHDSGSILAINAHLWGAVFPILQYGTTRQIEKYFPALLDGSLISGHAITEPHAGSDVANIQSAAKAINGGYRISGQKRFVTNAPIADFIISYIKVGEEISAFIIHSDDPGVVFDDNHSVSGCATAAMGNVIFDDSFVEQSRLLGKLGSGAMMIQQALELERAFIFAGLIGVMSWQLESVIKHSRERSIGGQPLAHKQAVYHRIAEMKTRLDSIRLWVHHCAQLKDSNQRLTLASAQTKLFASEAFLQSSLDAVQIFGASGLLIENSIAQLVQDAMASRLFSGSSELQKNIIAALLGTGESYRKPITK